MLRNRAESATSRGAVDRHLEVRSELHQARKDVIDADGRVSKFFANRALNRAVRAFDDSAEHVGMAQAVAEYPSSTPPVEAPQQGTLFEEERPEWMIDTPPMGIPVEDILSEVTRPQFPTQ